MTYKNGAPGTISHKHIFIPIEVAKRMMDEIRQRGKHDI